MNNDTKSLEEQVKQVLADPATTEEMRDQIQAMQQVIQNQDRMLELIKKTRIINAS